MGRTLEMSSSTLSATVGEVTFVAVVEVDVVVVDVLVDLALVVDDLRFLCRNDELNCRASKKLDLLSESLLSEEPPDKAEAFVVVGVVASDFLTVDLNVASSSSPTKKKYFSIKISTHDSNINLGRQPSTLF